MEINKFFEKLNKIDGNIYVVEERVELTGGVYDASLQHDNINTSTLSVYTGPKLTGERIQTYVLSTPSLTPWKRTIRVYADVPTVYISYEAEGDTVEAEDVNRIQEEMVRTQEAVNEEISRAREAEENIAKDLGEEVARAKAAEQTVTENLAAEINRSKGAAQELSWSLTAEISRAKAAEEASADNLTEEAIRAKVAENILTENVTAEKTRALAAEESIRDTIQINKPNWDNKYTRNEVDNKFATLENDIDWKETVNTYADIAVVYPNPQDGWTVNVKDTDYTYRYSGTEWVAISANAIPKATQSMDGLLSKEDKTLYDDANSKKHTHANKTTIDKVTETLLTRWNESYDKRHEHGNKGILETITQALLDNWNAAYVHIFDTVRHVTAIERTDWNDANSKKHSHSNKTILDGITQTLIDRWNTAEMNVQADWNVTDMTSDVFIKNKPTSLPASDVSAWAKASTKPSYAWSEIAGTPTKVSSFENDTGYITAADIDTSQNHTHANKSQLDTITQTSLNNWNASYTHVSNKSNPHGVTAAQIGAATANHNHSNIIPIDITSTAVDLNSYNLSDSTTSSVLWFICKTIGGAVNITNAAITGNAFLLKVEPIRLATATDYVTKQTFIPQTITAAFERYCISGVWQDWRPIPYYSQTPVPNQVLVSNGTMGGIKSSGFTIDKSVPSNAVFTDTIYTHPNSGAAAGTYRSVTVNALGHITTGTNPTTLAGYGITDSAAKDHNHDSTYLKKGALIWDDLKGV